MAHFIFNMLIGLARVIRPEFNGFLNTYEEEFNDFMDGTYINEVNEEDTIEESTNKINSFYDQEMANMLVKNYSSAEVNPKLKYRELLSNAVSLNFFGYFAGTHSRLGKYMKLENRPKWTARLMEVTTGNSESPYYYQKGYAFDGTLDEAYEDLQKLSSETSDRLTGFLLLLSNMIYVYSSRIKNQYLVSDERYTLVIFDTVPEYMEIGDFSPDESTFTNFLSYYIRTCMNPYIRMYNEFNTTFSIKVDGAAYTVDDAKDRDINDWRGVLPPFFSIIRKDQGNFYTSPVETEATHKELS